MNIKGEQQKITLPDKLVGLTCLSNLLKIDYSVFGDRDPLVLRNWVNLLYSETTDLFEAIGGIGSGNLDHGEQGWSLQNRI